MCHMKSFGWYEMENVGVNYNVCDVQIIYE